MMVGETDCHDTKNTKLGLTTDFTDDTDWGRQTIIVVCGKAQSLLVESHVVLEGGTLVGIILRLGVLAALR